MDKYIVRVELHGAVGREPYDILHSEMERLQFRRTIVGDDGNTVQLPSATYYGYSNAPMDIEAVRDLVKPAAEATGLSYWILATEFVRCAWLLPEA